MIVFVVKSYIHSQPSQTVLKDYPGFDAGKCM